MSETQAASAADIQSIKIEQAVRINAPRERVFEALTTQVNLWWGAPYLMSESSARDILLEARLGGRFFEDWGGGEGVLWGVVTQIKAPESLVISGPIGQTGPVAGVVTYTLEADGSGTMLKMSHHVIGDVDEETRAGYAGGWADLLGTRLTQFVEKGTRSGIRK